MFLQKLILFDSSKSLISRYKKSLDPRVRSREFTNNVKINELFVIL